MRTGGFLTRVPVVVVLILMAAFVLNRTVARAVTGAAFTTVNENVDGTGHCKNGNPNVNCNIYDGKEYVWLNGGPSVAYVGDGTYFFAVLDPGGQADPNDGSAKNLSDDYDAYTNRTFSVSGGLVTYGGTHDFGSNKIRLLPYGDTTNPGGVYIMAICSLANGYPANPSDCKYDAFRVQAGEVTFATVIACKFLASTATDTDPTGKPLIAFWPISATNVLTSSGDTGTVNDATGPDGCVSFSVTEFPDSGSASVTLTEGTQGGDWSHTTDVSVNVTVQPGDIVTRYFGNFNPNFNCPDAICAVSEPLQLTKTATPTFQRKFTWGISKSVDKTEIDTSSSAKFEYTVSVTHDAGTDSQFDLSGTITVMNPNDLAIGDVDVTDVPGIGTCTISGGAHNGVGETIPPGKNHAVLFNYDCSNVTATSTTTGTNTAYATDSAGHSNSTTADYNFGTVTPTVVDGSVNVSDSFGGSLGTVTTNDTSPTTFTYSHTFTDDPAGTCTSHDNTATFVTDGSGATGSAGRSVTVCVGANLTVSKTANPYFTRTYNWSISKNVDKTLVEQSGGQTTFNYTVDAKETGYADSGWTVTGKITVNNPNNWEAITANVTDTVDDGGVCVVSGGTNVSVPASGSVSLNYTCSYASGPSPASGTNTGSAAWYSSAAYTPGGSATGTAPFAFGAPTTTVNKSITVTDAFNGGVAGVLGYLTATNATPYASGHYTYSHTVANAPTGGSCKAYNNTAAITQTGQSASQTVNVCNTATGALTMGFWQNKNGQGIITGGASLSGVCKSGTWLRQYAPFQDLSATATCAQVASYVTTVIKSANASGAAMNAMLKGQMLATALDVYFSDAALGGNKINAAQPLGGVKIDLTKVCKMIDNTSTGGGTCSGTTVNASAAFGGAIAPTVSQLLTYAAGQSNVGGSSWYGNVKATQELAKNTFDEINNQAAQIAP